MDRGVKSCIYCHHDIDETAQRFHGGCNCPANRHKECPAYTLFVPVCKAIASSIKSWRGFIDIMMTEYTRFYSTIHLISKSASRFGHLNILKWLSLKIYKLSHFILSSIYNYTIYAIILTRPIYAIIQLTSKYPKSCFLYSFFQHRVVDKSIFLFSIDGFRVQHESNPDYKDIRSCATTSQFQALLLD